MEARRVIENFACQRRAEYARRQWPGSEAASCAAAVTDAVLRAKMKKTLDESALLQSLWKQSVTAEDLQAELNRMARDTNDPDGLRALFQALGNDPNTIAEALVRPLLVERRMRDLYAFDKSLHAAERQKAERLMSQVATMSAEKVKKAGLSIEKIAVKEGALHLRRHFAVKDGRERRGPRSRRLGVRFLSPSDRERLLARLPSDGSWTLRETREGFVVERLTSPPYPLSGNGEGGRG